MNRYIQNLLKINEYQADKIRQEYWMSYGSTLKGLIRNYDVNPNNFLKQINEVLKKDGILFMTMPFAWDEHEQPFDYARYTSFGISSILKKHGFEIITQRKSVSDIRVIFQQLNLYIWKKLRTKSGILNQIIILFLISPFNILGEILNLILPNNPDLYLDNIVLARKV